MTKGGVCVVERVTELTNVVWSNCARVGNICSGFTASFCFQVVVFFFSAESYCVAKGLGCLTRRQLSDLPLMVSCY